MPILKFPAEFPCPLVEGYGTEAYAAVLRTPFQAGNTRQRRIHKQLPHAIKLTWVAKQDVYGKMIKWLNTHGWDWFVINLPSPLAGLKGLDTCPHDVRLISDVSASIIRGVQGYYWRFSVTAEWTPTENDIGIPSFKNLWIIGGEPATPGDPDWIIAGTATIPSSPDVYIGGTPSLPSAKM